MVYYVSKILGKKWENEMKNGDRVKRFNPSRSPAPAAQEHLALKQPNKESHWEARRE